MAGLLGLSALLLPGAWAGFRANVSGGLVFGEGGIHNPSSLALLGELGDGLGLASATSGPHPAVAALYGLLVVAVLLFTVAALRRLARGQGGDGEGGSKAPVSTALISICLACLAMGLVLPRFKDYSYMLLLLPAYVIIGQIRRPWIPLVLYGAVMLALTNPLLPIRAEGPLWAYQPFWAAFLVWLFGVEKVLGRP